MHEKYYNEILNACKKYKDDKQVEGLLFNYIHFFGTYDYIGDSRKWYAHEVRIIRNDKTIKAYKDAQGFRKNGDKIKVKKIDAFIYHYGWVKSPEQMMRKHQNVRKFWHEDSEEWKKFLQQNAVDYNDFDSLEKFKGSHPQVMKERINKKNWELNLDISKKKFSFKDLLLYRFEKLTGKRLFDFKNYKII